MRCAGFIAFLGLAVAGGMAGCRGGPLDTDGAETRSREEPILRPPPLSPGDPGDPTADRIDPAGPAEGQPGEAREGPTAPGGRGR